MSEIVTSKRDHPSRIFRTPLLVGLMLMVNINGHTHESHRFNTEAEKLEKIREIFRAYEFSGRRDQAPACGALWSSLRFGTEVKAIEPVLRIDSGEDPRLQKWDCLDKMRNVPLRPGEYERLFEGLEYSWGNPPYRIYRLELDGNTKNGPEEVIYHEFDLEKGGHTGYSWVNTQRCTMEEYVAAENWSFSAKPMLPDRYRLNTIVRYQGEPVVVTVFDAHITDGGDPAYVASAEWFRYQKGFAGFCHWMHK